MNRPSPEQTRMKQKHYRESRGKKQEKNGYVSEVDYEKMLNLL